MKGTALTWNRQIAKKKLNALVKKTPENNDNRMRILRYCHRLGLDNMIRVMSCLFCGDYRQNTNIGPKTLLQHLNAGRNTIDDIINNKYDSDPEKLKAVIKEIDIVHIMFFNRAVYDPRKEKFVGFNTSARPNEIEARGIKKYDVRNPLLAYEGFSDGVPWQAWEWSKGLLQIDIKKTDFSDILGKKVKKLTVLTLPAGRSN
eukprot:Awhi_evm1s2593